MAEVNQDLVLQLEANIRAFESAGLDAEVESSKAKLAKVKRAAAKESAPETPAAKESAKEAKR